MTRLLLIEDEDVIRRALTRLLERNRYLVTAARDVDEAVGHDPRSFDLLLADLRLPGRDGTAVIPLADPVPVVIMTSHASVRSAVEAMRAGASDYVAKPFDHDELLLVLERALGRNLLGARNRALEHDLARAEPAARRVDGTSLEALVEALSRPEAGDLPLHLHGESGSGREDIARARHARGAHAAAPLLVFDANDADPERAAHLLLGADGPVPPGGLVRAARGGTLVLRHPERFPIALQRRLSERLAAGASGRRAAELRLVTISREPLGALRADGHLLPALDPQSRTLEREVPPLRRRRDDIAVLARRAAEALGRRHAGRPATLADVTLATLAARDWPGNVVELESAISRAVLLAPGPTGRPTRGGGGERGEDALELPPALFASVPPAARTLDLDAYFRYVVLRLQGELSETELAARLGISRKALWERRQKMALPRSTGTPRTPEKRDE